MRKPNWSSSTTDSRNSRSRTASSGAVGDYSEFANLSGGVEKLGIAIKKAGLERIPTQPVELTEEQMNEVENLLEKIEEDEDVQVVFTNIA